MVVEAVVADSKEARRLSLNHIVMKVFLLHAVKKMLLLHEI